MKLPLSDSCVLSNTAIEKLDIPAVSCGKISEARTCNDSENGAKYFNARHSTVDSVTLKKCVSCQECLFVRIQTN